MFSLNYKHVSLKRVRRVSKTKIEFFSIIVRKTYRLGNIVDDAISALKLLTFNKPLFAV